MALAEIIRIDSIKKSRNPRQDFIRVHFRVFTGLTKRTKRQKYTYAKMDLVPRFRNFRRWQGLLRKGNVLDNLEMLNHQTINADSFPILREDLALTLEEEKIMKFTRKYL